MIYVVANSITEAVSFAMRAWLGTGVRIYNESHEFTESDEVYVLSSAPTELKRLARVAHDKAWPRPHIWKEISNERAEARL